MADYSANTWSQVDLDNKAPVPDGLPPGTLPSKYYDVTWTLMGAAKREHDRTHVTVTSEGTGTAYTLTYEVFDAYVAGQTIRFKAHAANLAAPTININALGAKEIHANGGSALAAGDIREGSLVALHYDGTKFIMDLTIEKTPLIPGVDVQAYSDLLQDISGLTVGAGELVVGNGPNDLAMLPVGANDPILTIVGGVPTWAPPVLPPEPPPSGLTKEQTRRLINYYKLV